MFNNYIAYNVGKNIGNIYNKVHLLNITRTNHEQYICYCFC